MCVLITRVLVISGISRVSQLDLILVKTIKFLFCVSFGK